MPTVEEMAQAHLGNVQKAIGELEAQKRQIEEEINKLSAYLNEGSLVLTNSEVKSENN
jgi:hypothetical protein